MTMTNGGSIQTLYILANAKRTRLKYHVRNNVNHITFILISPNFPRHKLYAI